jgi:hypothetical protein
MADLEAGAEEPIKRVGHATGAVRWGWLLALLVPFLLVGCASWTNPTKPATAFADDVAACHAEAAQAAVSSGQADLDQDNASAACLRRKGWTLQRR